MPLLLMESVANVATPAVAAMVAVAVILLAAVAFIAVRVIDSDSDPKPVPATPSAQSGTNSFTNEAGAVNEGPPEGAAVGEEKDRSRARRRGDGEVTREDRESRGGTERERTLTHDERYG